MVRLRQGKPDVQRFARIADLDGEGIGEEEMARLRCLGEAEKSDYE
jgi:hypothetical protein